MAKGITLEWGEDIFGTPALIIRKARGKLTLTQIEELLRQEHQGAYRGNYALIFRCGELTCEGSGWNDYTEPVGDIAVLYRIEEGEPCPVCQSQLPDKDYCPHCGESLREEL